LNEHRAPSHNQPYYQPLARLRQTNWEKQPALSHRFDVFFVTLREEIKIQRKRKQQKEKNVYPLLTIHYERAEKSPIAKPARAVFPCGLPLARHGIAQLPAHRRMLAERVYREKSEGM